jgi:hypothetical protein
MSTQTDHSPVAKTAAMGDTPTPGEGNRPESDGPSTPMPPAAPDPDQPDKPPPKRDVPDHPDKPA